jgi:peptide/nickel transport system ATP-binding protein
MTEQKLPHAHKLLDVEKLTVAFGEGDSRVEVVRDLSLTIQPNQTIGLVGESGSGKSMTSLAIMGLLPRDASVTGSIRFQGEELIGRSDRSMRALRGDRLAIVFQDPLSSLNPYYTVGLQIEETYRAHRGGSQRAAHKIAIEALTSVQISDAEHRVNNYPHQFSGGMRQRIMIAMALCLEPDLIIADEPTTALDVTVQAGILKLLKQAQLSVGAGMLFISHDLAVVSQVADDIIVMQNGDAVEKGDAESIFSQPKSAYTRELLRAIPRIDDVVNESGAATDASEPLLSARGLTQIFPGPKAAPGRKSQGFVAVDDISFDVGANETLAIVGESGSGKSTTARIIAKLIEPTSGAISFEGVDVTRARGAALARFRRNVQVVFQDPFSSLNPRHTAAQIIAAPARYQKTGRSTMRRGDVQELMERVGLDPNHCDRYPWQFSGGQAQRIGIARALSLHPKLVICDEAVSALDVSVQARILELLDDLKVEFGLSYIFIAHDLAVVRRLADRVAVMNKGRIVESGSRDQIFDNPQDDYTKTLLAAVPTIPEEWDNRRQEGEKDG